MARVWQCVTPMAMSIREFHAAGMVFAAEEAVAIAQQLIASLRDPRTAAEVRPPYGPPSTANVFLKDDGAVVCRGCAATPTVSEVGIFLDDLLPAGSMRVPGGLRYTIARALLDVDVPPFDSLDELSRDLSRHERGNRAAIVRRTLARAHSHCAVAPVVFAERRRSRASATALRRELRDADLRLYRQWQGPAGQPAVIDLVAVAAAPAPRRGRTLTAGAACLAASVSLIAVGGFTHNQRAPVVAPQAALPVTTRQAAVPEPRVESDRATVAAERGIIAVRHVSSGAAPASRAASSSLAPASRPVAASSLTLASRAEKLSSPAASGADAPHVSVRRTTPRASAVTIPRRARLARPSRSVLDRLRLGWLRNALTSL